MKITHLTLCNFRNYKELSFTFSPKINCILGGNAQGKTNLLEALYLLSTGRSFRTPHLNHLIRHGASSFHVEAEIVRDGVTQRLKIGYDGQTREIIHNHTPLKSSAHLFGLLPVIIYSPEDIHLISGPPAKRRRFLDMLIAQYDPLYVFHLIRYFRAMKQRNFLLKTHTHTTLSNWEEQMSLSASYLIESREKALHSLLPTIQRVLSFLTEEADHIQIGYETDFALKKRGSALAEFYAKQYANGRAKEMRFGSTLIGPHKDDIAIHLNGKEAKIYSSEGQKRSCSLAFRLSEWERLNEHAGESPLMCLDDFGSHLDEKRQAILQERLPTFGQVFLTTPQSLPEPLANTALTLTIQEGEIKPSIEMAEHRLT